MIPKDEPKADADQEESPDENRKGKKDQWRSRWKDFMQSEKSAVDVMASLWECLPRLNTPLGKHAKRLTGDDAPPREVPHPRGDELLPVDIMAVGVYLEVTTDVTEAVKLTLTALNYLWLGGRDSQSHCPERGQPLTKAQRQMVDHVLERVTDLSKVEKPCVDFEAARAQLVDARFDYCGEPIASLEELCASKVIPVWPKIGEAAVQSVEDYLPPDMKELILDPRKSLLPVWEWPQRPPQSKVRASQEEWNQIVAAGFARGLMVGVRLNEVFTDQAGQPVLNGAAAVKKTKMVGGESKVLQRFISNFIPINAYMAHMEGGDKHLPYLGQLTLLEQEDDEVWVIDSEDFTSCYNLFRLPTCWHRYMAFAKPVDGRLVGGVPGESYYPAMAVVPMGWLNAVSVVQSVVRTLVFQNAEVPEDSEVSKLRRIPQTEDVSVIYLDSFDELRRLDRQCAEVLQNKASARHQRFLAVCQEKGLPLNEGKRLVASVRGSLQGGELQGDLGYYKLGGEKQVSLIGLASCLLGLPEWREFDLRHFVGKSIFGVCFRRPLLSVFQDIFSFMTELANAKKPLAPSAPAIDETILTLALVPMMGTSLKARLDTEMYCSDASPTGGGVAVATTFRREPDTEERDGSYCWICDRSLAEGDKFFCPARCQVALCSLMCVIRHRKGECHVSRACCRASWALPRFGERFAGKNARLSEAICLVGDIDVQYPFDWYFGHDFFGPDGKAFLEESMSDPLLVAEHWAPCCKLFTKARGRPIRLDDGTVIPGPQPVRDQAHLMGFNNLPNHMKVRLRQSNQMALKSLRRLEQAGPNNLYESLEHPLRSWLWEFTVAKRLVEDRFCESQGSHCCWGGEREKWYQFLHNCPAIHNYLHVDCPGHGNLRPYEVHRNPDGSLSYDTAEEAEYPWDLCVAYARGLKEQLRRDGRLDCLQQQGRAEWYGKELASSTERLADPLVNGAISVELALWEKTMVPGEELNHFKELLSMVSYCGTEVRAYACVTDAAEEQHEMPYPALRWEWKTLMAFPWANEAHINELEICALVATIKHRSRSVKKRHCRWFLVVDSMVTRGAVAKGRSPSRRLNRLLRKAAASLIAQNSYLYPLWTISRWNFSDRASRRYEK